MIHMSPTWRERALAAERRVAVLESQLAQDAAFRLIARELGEAEQQASRLLHGVFCAQCNDAIDVRHQVIDRLAVAELRMRRAAKEMVSFTLIMTGEP